MTHPRAASRTTKRKCLRYTLYDVGNFENAETDEIRIAASDFLFFKIYQTISGIYKRNNHKNIGFANSIVLPFYSLLLSVDVLFSEVAASSAASTGLVLSKKTVAKR